MNKKLSLWFLLLIISQGLHSIEEYIGKLWESFPPAKWLTGIFSSDHHLSFIGINVGIFLAGMASWYFFIKPVHRYRTPVLWFWIVLALVNGAGHMAWGITNKGYEPGVLTAPLLLIFAFLTIRQYLIIKNNSAARR